MPDDDLALPRDFRDFVRLLQAHGVEFVLVGAYAVGAHGRVRATGDIDFLYRASAGNVQRLCDAMRAFGAPANLIDPEFLQSGGSVTQIGNAPRRIELDHTRPAAGGFNLGQDDFVVIPYTLKKKNVPAVIMNVFSTEAPV